MPIYRNKQKVPSPRKKGFTPITPRPGERPDGGFKGSVVDTRKKDIRSLLRYADGSRWNIVYYRQLLGAESEPTSFQPNQINIYQQYEKIVDYPLRVESELSTNQDEETLQLTVNGTGLLFDGIIPNVNDVFMANSGDGRMSLFTVSQIERLTILLDSCHRLNYTLVDHYDYSKHGSIEDNVVRTLYYSDDHVGSGRGPLLTEKELYDYRYVIKAVDDIADYYSGNFTDPDTRLFLIPHDHNRNYDPYLAEAIYKLIPVRSFGRLYKPRLATINNSVETRFTIWTWLMGTRSPIGNEMYTSGKFEKPGKFYVDIIYNGIHMDNVDSVLVMEKNEIPTVPNTELPVKVPDIYPISLEGSYVFSPYFYAGCGEYMSFLERIVIDFINGKDIQINDLIDIYNKSSTWNDLERFYYFPVIYLLFTYYLRKTGCY